MKSKPRIFSTFSTFQAFIVNNPTVRLIDTYELQIGELFEILYPSAIHTSTFKQEQKKFIKQRFLEQKKGGTHGKWIYFPCNNSVVHMVSENEYFMLRTNRNRNLITLEEQKTLCNSSVAIAGLSIGSVIARALIQMGIANRMKVADFDKVSTTNLNRLPASILDIGQPKTEVFAKSVYEINPYQRLDIFSQGITENNVSTFLTKSYLPSVLIDAIDDFKVKMLLRLEAKKHHVPVIMFTNLFNSVVIDIERYDTDTTYLPFHGLIQSDDLDKIVEQPITEELKKKYAVTLIGRENVPERAIESLQQINMTLVGRPQLFGTLSFAAGIATYIIRELLLGNTLQSGRYRISLPDCFERQV